MTNGPRANIAEIVRNPLPRSRQRESMHREADYYPLRNHLLDFLVTRSGSFKETMAATGYDPRNPPVVEPTAPSATAPAVAAAAPRVQETLEHAAV